MANYLSTHRSNDLPHEPRKLAIVMIGSRLVSAWDVKDSPSFDFYDMKGRIELLLAGLRFTDIIYAETSSTYQLHPGKSAEVKVNGQVVGVFGVAAGFVAAFFGTIVTNEGQSPARHE